MINGMQAAIIKKDIRAIISNKRMLSVLIIVPIVMAIGMPLSLGLSILLAPLDGSNIEQFSSMLGPSGLASALDLTSEVEVRRVVFGMLYNNILPLFFLMIPIITSSAMAASAFVGEKERNTLETLLYCPLPLNKIFSAKIIASFLVGFAISLISFVVMTATILCGSLFLIGAAITPGLIWFAVLLLVAPAVSFIAISLIVRGSAKAQSSEEAQQRGALLVLPVVLLAVGQFAGLLMLSAYVILVGGAALALVAWLLFRGLFAKFKYETLLR
ncbi:MAG: ABC transporter permease subunit [Treponema sp.]|nr:ABC transporter permease subunit [Treponema sp.]